MSYVLIVFWWGYMGGLSSGVVGGPAMQEFLSKETCEQAAEVIKQQAEADNKYVRAACVRK